MQHSTLDNRIALIAVITKDSINKISNVFENYPEEYTPTSYWELLLLQIYLGIYKEAIEV